MHIKKNVILRAVKTDPYLVLDLGAAQLAHGGPQPLVHHARHVADLVQLVHPKEYFPFRSRLAYVESVLCSAIIIAEDLLLRD